MEDVQGKRAEQLENKETTPTDEVRKEIEEVEVYSGGAEVFLTIRGRDFQKDISKKGFIGERGFKELVPSFKEEIERKG